MRKYNRVFRPSVETLEDRCVPAYFGGIFSWKGPVTGGAWTDPKNWNVQPLVPGQTPSDSYPGQALVNGSSNQDNVDLSALSSKVDTGAGYVIGYLNVSLVTVGNNTGAFTVTGILKANGPVTLLAGSGTLTINGVLDVNDGANDNSWGSGNISGSGKLDVTGNGTGMTFARTGAMGTAPSPGSISTDIVVGSGTDSPFLTVGDINQDIIVPSNAWMYIHAGASVFLKTTPNSPAHFMGASGVGSNVCQVAGKLYRDCVTSSSEFDLGYAVQITSSGTLEIYNAPQAGGTDTLPIMNRTSQAPDGNNYSVYNDGGTAILGEAAGGNRGGVGHLIVDSGLYQGRGHLYTEGLHVEEISMNASAKVFLAGGDMTFSADHPTNIGTLSVDGNFEFGAGSTWNWYATEATVLDTLNVRSVGGQGGVVTVDAAGGVHPAPAIVCNAPTGILFQNVIGCVSYVDTTPTHFKLSVGYTGRWINHTTYSEFDIQS
jgi:hypothetical protein